MRATVLLLLPLLAGFQIHASAEESSKRKAAAENGAAPRVTHRGELDLSEAESIAVQDAGRKKPLHTLAAESIEQITGRPFFLAVPYWKDPETQERHSALDTYLSMWLASRSRDEWRKLPLVLVAYLPLRKDLGLEEQEKRFSFEQILRAKRQKESASFGGDTRLEELVGSAHRWRQEKGESQVPELEQQAEIVFARLQLLGQILTGDTAYCVPHPSDPNGTWISLELLQSIQQKGEESVEDLAETLTRGDKQAARGLCEVYRKAYPPERTEAVFTAFRQFREAYMERDAVKFPEATRAFRSALTSLSPQVYPKDWVLDLEVGYAQTRPFGKAWLLYLLAVVAGVVTFRLTSRAARWPVMGLYFAGIGFHLYGFVIRCLVAGRPPVSNMFESVIWVGLGVVAFGLIFELIYRPKYFLICGAAGGFLCLVLMDLLPVVMGNPNLPGFEATINPLVPVLRDNFWLTVHVLTITLSYAAFALASVLGHVTLGRHLFFPSQQVEHRQMHQFVYRVLQVGVMLLATGTILGGVWAYYSWGRFWGWDPKETWAFIGLVSFLIVLHGRFTGWWGNFGMCVGSVLGFWPIMMAWYGVNFVLPKLGQGGLHSYGKGSGGELCVVTIAAVDVLFAGLVVYRHLGISRQSIRDVATTALSASDPVDDARAAEARRLRISP